MSDFQIKSLKSFRFLCHSISLFALFISIPTFTSAQYYSLTISEIMYNPDGDDYYTEYVEIYNTGDQAINLSFLKIQDEEESDQLIPSPGSDNMVIQPQSYALILDSGYFTNGEGIYDSHIPEGTLLVTIEDAAIGSGSLSNSVGETLSLTNYDSDVISSRQYIPGASQGVSEEKIDLDGDNSDSNWEFGTGGGTPGYAKITTAEPSETYGNHVTILPNPFSPNGDGFEDEAIFQFRFPTGGVAITIRLFDSAGTSLGKILDNRVVDGEYEWRWNGRAGDGNAVLDAGIYVYVIRAQEIGGKRHWDSKGTIVTTGQ